MKIGKIIGLDLKPNFVVVTHTSNDVEAGQVTPKDHTTKVYRKPSDELVTSLRVMLSHALIYCKMDNNKIGEKELKSRKIVDMPEFRGFEVTGFKISGDNEEEKIQIKLSKECKNDEVISFGSPKIAIHDGTYPYDFLLGEDLGSLIEEVTTFIEGKNYYVQGALDLQPAKEEKEKNPVDEI